MLSEIHKYKKRKKRVTFVTNPDTDLAISFRRVTHRPPRLLLKQFLLQSGRVGHSLQVTVQRLHLAATPATTSAHRHMAEGQAKEGRSHQKPEHRVMRC